MKIRIKKNISLNWLFVVIGIFLIFEPDYCKTVVALDSIYLFGEFLVLIGVAFSVIYRKIKLHYSWYVILFFSPMYISTLVYGQPFFFAFRKTIVTICACMFFELCLFKYGRNFILTLGNVIFSLLIINAISFVFFPKGMVAEMVNTLNDKIYFLSNKNGMISWCLIPTIIFMLFYFNDRNVITHRRLLLCIIISTINIIYTGSSTGAIGWFMMVALYWLLKYGITKQYSMKKIAIIAICMFFCVNIFRIQHIFMGVFDLLFGKKTTFSGREWIWDQALNVFKQAPILGYGIREKTMIITDYGRYYSAHNFVLDTLISGGLSSIVIFFAAVIGTIRRNKSFLRSKTMAVLGIAVLVFFVCTLTETPLQNFKWWLILAMAYNGREIHQCVASVPEMPQILYRN